MPKMIPNYLDGILLHFENYKLEIVPLFKLRLNCDGKSVEPVTDLTFPCIIMI